MQKKIVFTLAILALILTSCATAKATQSPRTYDVAPSSPSNGLGAGEGMAPAPAAMPTPASKGGDTYSSDGSGPNPNIAAAQQRLIVQNVDMTIVVSDVQAKMDAINKLASTLGGYLVSMSVNQVAYGEGSVASQGTISIRVPAAKLDDALTKIKADAVDVPNEKRSGQDVTSQYVDLQSQLKNLQQAEQDLQAIMDEAKNNSGNDTTTKTQDVLNVYNQIVAIRGQIEQIQGQMKYIEETTTTSAINVSLIAEETVQPIVTGQWKPLVTASKSVQGLVKFLQGFVDFLIIFVIRVIPMLIIIFGPIALIIWAIVAGIKRRRTRKAA